MRLLGEVEGEDLYGEGGVPHEEDDAGGDDDDQDQDGVAQALLLVCRVDLTPNNPGDFLPNVRENGPFRGGDEMRD